MKTMKTYTLTSATLVALLSASLFGGGNQVSINSITDSNIVYLYSYNTQTCDLTADRLFKNGKVGQYYIDEIKNYWPNGTAVDFGGALRFDFNDGSGNSLVFFKTIESCNDFKSIVAIQNKRK